MAIAGKDGSFKIYDNGVKKDVQEINEWSIDLSVDTEDVSAFDENGWKSFLATLKEWSGSISGNWTLEKAQSGQRELFEAFMNNRQLEVDFIVDNVEGHFYRGKMMLTSLPVTNAVAGVVEFSADFQGTGILELWISGNK